LLILFSREAVICLSWQGLQATEEALNQKTMEMEAAREIPAEVFGVRLQEVDEMIWRRLEAEAHRDGGLWPR
jgi:hypothetical protein